MSHSHSHSHNHRDVKSNRLLWAIFLTGTFFIVEAVGGFLTGSLALISDAAHMLTDVSALIIAWVAIKIGQKPADEKRTFGYYRFEILAAAFNTLLLFCVAIYILYEAYQRLNHPPEILSTGMLVIASIGLIINLISMKLLGAHTHSSLNMKISYLEVWSDMIGSVGVIIGALIIRFTGWTVVDSIIAVLIGLWVLPRTWILLKESINILLEAVPKGIDVKQVKAAIKKVDGVMDVHDLHIWALTNDKINLTAHVVIDETQHPDEVVRNLRDLMKNKFNICHTTFQQEKEKCLAKCGH